MHEFILWCAFIGGWLLFAGPIYQAVLELQAEGIEMDRIRLLASQVQKPPPTSAWWWLLPPVHVLLERRRNNRYQQLLVEVMTDEDYEALTNFMNKATGWFFVGLGGLLIAVKETFELTDGLEWSVIVFWVLVVLMLALSVANAAGRIAHSERERARRRGTA